MPKKILLDTDIGSDIDDAVCLAYLLMQSECELLGITTVSGEARKRAMLASALCKVANKNIPIYPGAETPLQIPQQQPEAPQASALQHWPHETEFPQGEAVDFMRRTIRKYPGEITLLTIGPLTNIAMLFTADPEIPSLLKGLVMMCGNWGGLNTPEWNASLDPHATAMIYQTSITSHRSIGLNVTMKVQMEARQVKKRFFKHPLLKVVLDFARIWFLLRDYVVFHDPLAAATLFDDSICTFQRGQVEVELEKEGLQGQTRWLATPQVNHEVASGVQAERFFDHYFSVFE